MQQKIPRAVPAILAVLIVAALGWLGFSNWQMKNELAELKQQQADPGSITTQQ